MSLYAVKNDECGYAFCEIGKPHWETDFGTLWTELYKPYAQRTADDIGGQVVPLIEAPAKVVVSEEEARMLASCKDPLGSASGMIRSHLDDKWTKKDEDRLMRAYVNDWTVEKPKRYIVLMKLPGKKGSDDRVWHYMRALRSQQGDYIWWEFANADGTCRGNRNDTFTLAEIEHYGLGDCEKVVCADSARTTGEVKD